jgi:uncharacterized protein YaaW (UPF0174 family)
MPFDDALFQRLRKAQRPDLLLLLADLKLDAQRLKDKSDDELIGIVSKQLRSVAGSSFANVARGKHDLPYKRILIDVADKLAPGRLKWSQYKMSGPETESQIEDYILQRLEARLSELIKAMSEDDKRKLQTRLEDDMRAKGLPEAAVRGAVTALSTGVISGVAFGPLIASLLFGGLWTALFGLTIAQLLLGGVAIGGPVGLVLATIAVVTGPSYSKTIPAVYRLIVIRQSFEEREGLRATR